MGHRSDELLNFRRLFASMERLYRVTDEPVTGDTCDETVQTTLRAHQQVATPGQDAEAAEPTGTARAWRSRCPTAVGSPSRNPPLPCGGVMTLIVSDNDVHDGKLDEESSSYFAEGFHDEQLRPTRHRLRAIEHQQLIDRAGLTAT